MPSIMKGEHRMKSSIDIDSDTLKKLKYLYKYKKEGITASQFMKKFGIESSAFLLEFCKLGYISFVVENHPVSEHDFSSYIDNRLRKDLPFITGKEIVFCMPKGNKIVESHRQNFLWMILPLIISVISLLFSVGTFVYSVTNDSTIKVEIVSEEK